MTAIQDGDESALDELVRRKTGPLIQTVARIIGDREEARDVAQIVFLRVWEKRESFDPRWSPNTWLYRIGVNLAVDLVRIRKTQRQVAEPLRHHLHSVRTSGSRGLAELEGREVTRIFEDLSRRLSERQRVVFLLVAVEGMSSTEAGEILGCSASTVRNHLLTARRQLRADLTRLYPEYGTTAGCGQPTAEEES